MKKLLIIFLILFAIQESFGQFTFGPKVGYATSKLSTDFDSIKESVKHNFQIGAFARFGKKFYFQPEFVYATSGGTLKNESTGAREEIDRKNICIPLLVGFKLINAKVINLRVMAGPVVNYDIGTKIESNEYVINQMDPDDLKKASLGLDMGAGVDVLIFSLDLRYELGLNNIYNGDMDMSMKSNMFIVSLGIKLL